MLERLLPIICALLGAMMLYVSLENTIGYVGHLWIVGLIAGSQLVVMAIRSAVRHG